MEIVKRYITLSQVSLFSLLLVCTATIPSIVTTRGGASNFGDHTSTVVPYVLGFGLCAVFLCLAATRLLSISDRLRIPASRLLFLALLLLLVLISTFPRKVNSTYSALHDYIGVALYLYEFLLSAWLVVNKGASLAVLFLCIESIGSVIGFLSLENVIHLLFVGQIVGAIGFGLLLPAAFPSVVATRACLTD